MCIFMVFSHQKISNIREHLINFSLKMSATLIIFGIIAAMRCLKFKEIFFGNGKYDGLCNGTISLPFRSLSEAFRLLEREYILEKENSYVFTLLEKEKFIFDKFEGIKECDEYFSDQKGEQHFDLNSQSPAGGTKIIIFSLDRTIQLFLRRGSFLIKT